MYGLEISVSGIFSHLHLLTAHCLILVISLGTGGGGAYRGVYTVFDELRDLVD